MATLVQKETTDYKRDSLNWNRSPPQIYDSRPSRQTERRGIDQYYRNAKEMFYYMHLFVDIVILEYAISDL